MKKRRQVGRPRKTADWLAPRERLLNSARELFYRKGVSRTGVDELTEHAGISKMSLYAHFPSKDELIAEYVTDRDRAFRRWLDEQMGAAPQEPRARLLHVFDAVGSWVGQAHYCGCAFINAAAQLNDPSHPGFAAAGAAKAALRARLEDLARDARLEEPERLARQLSLLIDGTLVAAAMERSGAPVAAAREAAAALVAARAGGPTSGARARRGATARTRGAQ